MRSGYETASMITRLQSCGRVPLFGKNMLSHLQNQPVDGIMFLQNVGTYQTTCVTSEDSNLVPCDFNHMDTYEQKQSSFGGLHL